MLVMSMLCNHWQFDWMVEDYVQNLQSKSLRKMWTTFEWQTLTAAVSMKLNIHSAC